MTNANQTRPHHSTHSTISWQRLQGEEAWGWRKKRAGMSAASPGQPCTNHLMESQGPRPGSPEQPTAITSRQVGHGDPPRGLLMAKAAPAPAGERRHWQGSLSPKGSQWLRSHTVKGAATRT